MVTRILDRTLRRYSTCRTGHLWTDMATPMACSRCGRIRSAR